MINIENQRSCDTRCDFGEFLVIIGIFRCYNSKPPSEAYRKYKNNKHTEFSYIKIVNSPKNTNCTQEITSHYCYQWSRIYKMFMNINILEQKKILEQMKLGAHFFYVSNFFFFYFLTQNFFYLCSQVQKCFASRYRHSIATTVLLLAFVSIVNFILQRVHGNTI